MALSASAKDYLSRFFPGPPSPLWETDPEFMELFANFALDEVVNQGDLDDVARMMAILAALLGCQGVEEYRVLLPAALLLVRGLPGWSLGAFLIAELATCAVSLALYGKLRREKIDTIGTASGGL